MSACGSFLMNVVFSPESLSGIQIGSEEKNSNFQNKVIHIARIPVVGVLTSSLAIIINLVRLVLSVAAFPLCLIAGLVTKNKDPIIFTAMSLGGSIASSAYAISNIATLGFASWRLKPSLQ